MKRNELWLGGLLAVAGFFGACTNVVEDESQNNKYPMELMAEKSAIRFSANHVFDYIELTKEYSIFEIQPLQSWIGKTIAEVSIREKYQMSVLAIKINGDVFPLPKADHVFTSDQHIIAAGKKSEMVKFLKKI